MDEKLKTLGESYEGMLSRDWEKLLTILESGGRRVHIYTEAFMDILAERVDICGVIKIGVSMMEYRIANYVGIYSRKQAIEVLEKSGIGWFPTKEDEL